MHRQFLGDFVLQKPGAGRHDSKMTDQCEFVTLRARWIKAYIFQWPAIGYAYPNNITHSHAGGPLICRYPPPYIVTWPRVKFYAYTCIYACVVCAEDSQRRAIDVTLGR